MKKLILIGFCTMLLWIGPHVNAALAEGLGQDPVFLGVQSGYLNGSTRYRISEYLGTSGFQSKLEFPLQTFLAGIYVVLRPESGRDRNNLSFSLSWMTNIGSGSGNVKDSDWMSDDQDIAIVGAAHPGLDIYSESGMRLKANLLDIRADLQIDKIKNLYIGPMIGFKHQSFQYDIMNVNQVGYGPYASSYTGSVPGLVGTYEVTYDIPYFGVSADLKPDAKDSFTGTARIGFAPVVSADDKDEHLLRSKTGKGSANGRAFLAALGAEWKISSDALFRINGEYLRIFTEGTQNQYFYAGPDAGMRFSVPDKIDSAQLSFSVSLVFKLELRGFR